MTQQQLNQLVADATGEDLHEIQRRGFSMANPADTNFDPEPYGMKQSGINKKSATRKRCRHVA